MCPESSARGRTDRIDRWLNVVGTGGGAMWKVIFTSDCPRPGWPRALTMVTMPRERLRCTHLSFDYARGKYPERVRKEHTINVKRDVLKY